MVTKTTLTVEEQINRAKEGRSQSYIVREMVKRGVEITDVGFSRKKKGWDSFTEDELKVLSKVLGAKIVS